MTGTDPSHPLRILAVDDDDAHLAMLDFHARHVPGWAIDLVAMTDGQAAVAHLLRTPADVVLLDYHLGDNGRGSGLDVLRQLRQAGYSRPIIILTGTADSRATANLWREGADDFIEKSELSPESLDRTLRLVLGRHRAEAELADARRRIEQSRNQLAAVLERLRIGVVVADASHDTVFVNTEAGRLFEVDVEAAIRRPWLDLFGVTPAEVGRLRAQLSRPEAERRKVTLHFSTPSGRERSADIEVCDDPANEQGRIAFIYDVTEVLDLRHELEGRQQIGDLVGRSAAMTRLMDAVRDLAAVDASVVIEGETGTGKELVARAIHDNSDRRARPFIAVNCAGLSESLLASQLFGHRRGAFTGALQDQKGFFEAAEGGTLLLDEIGDVSLPVQTMLLRVLQEREVVRVGDTSPRKVNVRILAATHKHLPDLVQSGAFRQDLMYRLRVARVTLPPLRARREDIPLLVQRFLRTARSATGKPVERVDAQAMRRLLTHDWPGNVRELKSAIEFAVIHCKRNTISASDLPPEISETGQTSRARAPNGDIDKATVMDALDQARGNRSVAARSLGVGRSTLYRWLDAMELPTEGPADHA